MSSRILIAEDNERLAAMLRSFLESLGHEVESKTDGGAAFATLEAAPPDLLILDLKLPVMSGVEVLQRVKKKAELQKVPIIVMTGAYRGEQYARAAAKLGVKAYLEKPFTRGAFLAAVDSALPQAPQGPLLLELLADLQRGSKSGVLEFPDGASVFFIKGVPVSFTSSQFLSFLSSSGRIPEPDLDQYARQDAGRLRLTEAGLIIYDELLDQSRLFLGKLIQQRIEQNVAATFRAEIGAIELPLTPVSLPRLMHEAARTLAGSFDRSALLQKHGGKFPAKTGRYYRLANLFRMGREEIELLERVTGLATLSSLVSASQEQAQAASFLELLLRLGMVSMEAAPTPEQPADFPQKRLFNRPIEEVAEAQSGPMNFEDLVDEVSDSIELVVGEEGMAAPLSAKEINFEQEVQRDYAAIQDKNYYEIFSLTQGSFNFKELKEAYFSKTRQYSPEKFMQLSGATLSRAQDVLSHYANAYNTLSNVVAKERYDEMLNANSIGLGGKKEDELQARIQFQSGKVFLEMDDFSSAERVLQDAYTLAPEDAPTSAYLAWSIYKNPSNTGSRAAHEKCRMLLSKSLQMGKCAEAFAFRGWMLLDEGRDGLAEGEFQKALKLNPRERVAQDGMRFLTERRESDKKGLFKRIFG
jgi:DNA-binding response OmpR family regulator/tetratricopeptide (TPR) repeat protein